MLKTIKYLLLGVLLVKGLTVSADAMTEEQADSVYKIYMVQYSKHNDKDKFYALSHQLKSHFLTLGNLDRYYKLMMNEALYEAERNNTYQAIKMVNNLLEDMKYHNFDHFNLVSQSLGTIFESRGNYHMAQYHYRKGIEETASDNDKELVAAYLRLASLLKFQQPTEAKKWNEKGGEMSEPFINYHQIYLYIKAVICFSLNDKAAFEEAYHEYNDFSASKELMTEYGKMALDAINLFYQGETEEAMRLVRQNDIDLDVLSRQDMLIIMMKQMGDYRGALRTSKHRMELVDSLNSDMLFDNMNEINASAGVLRAQQQEADARERMLIRTILFILVILAILMVWTYRRIKVKRELQKKNELLRSALQMAEESDRMKSEFVRSVSHEMRTPLNAISSFSDILNNPRFELNDEQREDYLNRVHQNIDSLTKVIDELLNVADLNSSDYYIKTSLVACNQLIGEIVELYQKKTVPYQELIFTTEVNNHFSINTNAHYVYQIMDQLLSNALKHTPKGTIEIHCCQKDDQLLLSVTDTGTGIPVDMQEKIFDQFTKVDNQQQGIGLGLTVSRKIAQKLGGNLTLDTSYTQGARFVLSLPIK